MVTITRNLHKEESSGSGSRQVKERVFRGSKGHASITAGETGQDARDRKTLVASGAKLSEFLREAWSLLSSKG